jgi:hypothetical protein
MSEAWRNLEGRREYIRRNAENSTRLATAHGRFQTTGWGEIEFEQCFVFGLTFIEKPSMSYGYSIADDDVEPVLTRFPRSAGFVSRWKMNEKGFYVGAWCAVVVEDQSTLVATTEDDPNYLLDHDYRFEGIAMKDVPAYLGEGA